MRDTPFNCLTNGNMIQISTACQIAGFFKPITSQNICAAMDNLVLYHVFLKRKEQILSIKKALRDCKLHEYLHCREYLWDGIFLRTEEFITPASLVKAKILVEGDGWNTAVLEAIMNFIDTECTGNCKFFFIIWLM